MKLKTTGKSLKELLEIYGTGSAGFCIQEWYKSEKFFEEKPEAGEWDFDFDTDLTNLIFSEQIKKLKKNYKPVHPAILTEAILSHYRETGKRLLKNTYSRTNILGSGGRRVSVGSFDAEGLYVDLWYGFRDGAVGVSSARKLLSVEPVNLDTFESRLLALEADMHKIKEIIKI